MFSLEENHADGTALGKSSSVSIDLPERLRLTIARNAIKEYPKYGKFSCFKTSDVYEAMGGWEGGLGVHLCLAFTALSRESPTSSVFLSIQCDCLLKYSERIANASCDLK